MIAFLEEIRKQLDLIDKRTEEIRNQLDLTEQAVNKIGDDIGQLERYMKTEKPLISVKALEERKKSLFPNIS